MTHPITPEFVAPVDADRRRLPTRVWIALVLTLTLWVAIRLGAFDLAATVTLSDGRHVSLPTVFATVDHPFHAARAETLRRALADGRMLRWIGGHQGGYPVEFYPLGFAAFEVALWALALGLPSMAAIHKLAVIFTLLAPGVGFALIARRDRLPLGIALLALTWHVSIRGWWWSGGSMELVEWGLAPNVAAAAAILATLGALTKSVFDRSSRWAGAAALLAAFAVLCNPRSTIALAVVGIAVVAAAALEGGKPKAAIRVVAAVAVVAALVAAPLLISLVRFEDLYYFVHFSAYADLGDYWRSSVQAVSSPALGLAVIGLISTLPRQGRPATRAVAVALMLYIAVAVALTLGWLPDSLIEQLEVTRLMPFQRLLTLYLAAVGAWDLARGLAGLIGLPAWRSGEFGLVAGAALIWMGYVVAPPSFVPEGDRGLVDVPTAATADIADLRAAIEAADEQAPPGTAVLVLGSTLSWHAQLWAPIWSDRPFFYDDWLWYWQTDHVGPYGPLTEHAYDPARMGEVLARDFLDRHGIGAVVIATTARTRQAAAIVDQLPWLTPARRGAYDLYLVNSPTLIVTVDGRAATEVVVQQADIRATLDGGGTVVVRRNWHPRWRANADGAAVTIRKTADGYLTFAAPAGATSVEVRYAVDRFDWAARIAAVVGVVIALGAVAGGATAAWPRRTIAARRSSASGSRRLAP